MNTRDSQFCSLIKTGKPPLITVSISLVLPAVWAWPEFFIIYLDMCINHIQIHMYMYIYMTYMHIHIYIHIYIQNRHPSFSSFFICVRYLLFISKRVCYSLAKMLQLCMFICICISTVN